MNEDTTESERLTKSEAKEKAIENFHEWNDVTGIFRNGESYIYEIESVIEDAVEFGMKANDSEKGKASGVRVNALVRCFTNAIKAMEELKAELEHRNFEHALIETRKAIDDLEASRELLLREQ